MAEPSDRDQPGNPFRRFGRWVAGLGPGAIPLGVAVLCLIGFGLPLVLVLANPTDPAEAWPAVEAEVVEVTPVSVVRTDDRTGQRRKVTQYLVLLRYTVDGVQFERSPGGTSDWHPSVGQRVTVHHDPDHPQDITLSAQRDTVVPWLLGSLGLGFVAIFGVTGLVLVRKGVSWRRSQRGPFGPPGPGQVGSLPSSLDWVARVGPTKPAFAPYRPEADSAITDSDAADGPAENRDDLR